MMAVKRELRRSKMFGRIGWMVGVLLVCASFAMASATLNGPGGLLQVPTAEVGSPGQAEIYLNYVEGVYTGYSSSEKYSEENFGVNVVPIRGLEIGTVTHHEAIKELGPNAIFSMSSDTTTALNAKWNCIKENKNRPSLAVGGINLTGSGSYSGGQRYLYGVISKSYAIPGSDMSCSLHVGYIECDNADRYSTYGDSHDGAPMYGAELHITPTFSVMADKVEKFDGNLYFGRLNWGVCYQPTSSFTLKAASIYRDLGVFGSYRINFAK
jgi:hypothetical protein